MTLSAVSALHPLATTDATDHKPTMAIDHFGSLSVEGTPSVPVDHRRINHHVASHALFLGLHRALFDDLNFHKSLSYAALAT
jgi:hypothetical protein